MVKAPRLDSLVFGLFFLVLFAAASSISAPAQASADDEMRAGILAYQFSDYSSAAEHFQAALELNPALIQARLLLATSYAQQYIAGDQTAANIAMAEQAIDEFKILLSQDLTEEQQYKSTVPIASLSFNLKRFDQAREYYGKAIKLKPEEPRNYFATAMIDQTEAYQAQSKARSEAGLTASEMLSAPAACVALRTQNQQRVEDGMQRLQKVLELQPDNGDAMGYLNLFYRERAEYECDDTEARKADLKAADEWTDKAIAAKKGGPEKHEAEKTGGGDAEPGKAVGVNTAADAAVEKSAGSAAHEDEAASKPAADKAAEDNAPAPEKAADNAGPDKSAASNAVTDNAAAEAPADKGAADKSIPDQPAAGNAATGNAPAEKPASEKAAADDVTSGKPSPDKAAADNAAPDQPTADKAADNATPEKSAGNAAMDGTAAEKPAEKAAQDNAAPDKPAADKTAADNATTETPADKAPADNSATGKSAASDAASDNAPAEKPAAENAAQDKPADKTAPATADKPAPNEP